MHLYLRLYLVVLYINMTISAVNYQSLSPIYSGFYDLKHFLLKGIPDMIMFTNADKRNDPHQRLPPHYDSASL